eukprot:7601679-Pyramimonas_sp.AAC.1
MSLRCQRARGAMPVWPTAVRPLKRSAARRRCPTLIRGSSAQSSKSGGFSRAPCSWTVHTSLHPSSS